MTVYVDNYEGRFRRMIMCHMFSDESIDELVEMAEKIGVHRRWIQHLGVPGKAVHFDICKSHRDKAIKAGAVHLPIIGEGKDPEEWRRVRNAAKELNRRYIVEKPLRNLWQAINGYAYSYGTEIELQNGIEDALMESGYVFRREHTIGQDRIDFLVNADGRRIALECKIAGGPSAVLEQLLRYANQPDIDGVLLVTSRHTHRFDCDTLNGKPFSIAWIAGKL